MDAIKGSAKASLIGTLALGAMLGACNKNPPAEPAGQEAVKAEQKVTEQAKPDEAKVAAEPAGQEAVKADQKAAEQAKPDEAKVAAKVEALEALYLEVDSCPEETEEICEGGYLKEDALKGLLDDPDAVIAFYAKHQTKFQHFGNTYFKPYDACVNRHAATPDEAEEWSEVCIDEVPEVPGGGFPSEFKKLYDRTKREVDHAKWLKAHQLPDGYRALWVLVDEARKPDLTEDRAKEIAKEIVGLMKAGLKPDVANWEGKIPLLSITHPAILQAMAQAGADLKIKDAQGNGILHRKSVSLALLNLALAAGVGINDKNAEGKTPVFYVSELEILKAFVKAGADLKVTDQKGVSSIQNCIQSNETPRWSGLHSINQDCLKLYREAGLDPNAKDGEGETLYTRLFKLGTSKEIYNAIVSEGFDVKAALPDFMKAFKARFQDCERGVILGADSVYYKEGCEQLYNFYENLIPELISKGLDVQARDPETGNSYLFYVSSEEIANTLIKAGLDVNAKNKEGKTALYFTHESPAIGALTAMVKAGAKTGDDLLQVHLKTVTPERWAMHTYQVPCMLLKQDASRYSKDAIGKLLLSYCSFSQTNEIDGEQRCEGEPLVPFLLKLKPNLEVRDDMDMTMLMWCDDKEEIEQLIKAGADVNAKDMLKQSVLQHHEDDEIIGILKAAGAK